LKDEEDGEYGNIYNKEEPNEKEEEEKERFTLGGSTSLGFSGVLSAEGFHLFTTFP